mgnify:CR=1 FL=1
MRPWQAPAATTLQVHSRLSARVWGVGAPDWAGLCNGWSDRHPCLHVDVRCELHGMLLSGVTCRIQHGVHHPPFLSSLLAPCCGCFGACVAYACGPQYVLAPPSRSPRTQGPAATDFVACVSVCALRPCFCCRAADAQYAWKKMGECPAVSCYAGCTTFTVLLAVLAGDPAASSWLLRCNCCRIVTLHNGSSDTSQYPLVDNNMEQQ